MAEGAIDTTNLPAGHYVLKLVPADAINVLRSDIDLSVPQGGNLVTQATSVSAPDDVEFDISAP